MKNKTNHILFFLLIYLIVTNCKETITPPEKQPFFTNELKGKVFLENQTEHSNALVYIDSLNRGVSTDSSGNYLLKFSDEDSSCTGEFKVYYFLNDYDMDSAMIALVKGKVKLDSLDVDRNGTIKTKELKQIVLIEGWTDITEYRIGDNVTFTARVTNLSDRQINIFIGSCNGILSNFVFLYNDKYLSFQLGGEHDVLTLDCDIYLSPGEYYEGTIIYEIIEYKPLVPDEYIITTGFLVEGRTLNHLESKFYKYVVEEWYKIHQGISPKYDKFPNKYNFPHVYIIQ